MPDCHYCSEPATTKRRIYDEVMRCSSEVDVCEDCDQAITDGILGREEIREE